MALDSNNLVGLYVALAIYFSLLAMAAFWAYQRLQRARKAVEVNGGKEDQIESHYLGNRSFGTLMTAGSMFASFFSGYTVVGVPNEAYSTGWLALRWAVATIGIVLGFLASSARLRKIGILRNHQSPVDFITDRFQSQILRYTAVLLMLFPAIIYLTAQLVSIRSTFNSLFNIDPESPVAVIIIASLILLFEWMGGLSSVAMTDLIQGCIMVTVFVILPIVISQNYGGWSDLEWDSYPKQEFYQTPSGNEQWLFWNFVVILSGGFIQPHLIQRVYAAENFKALKVTYSILALGPWLTMIAGVFLGTVGVQVLSDLGVSQDEVSSPYASILEAVMDLGGFGYFIGVLASTSTLAAIMSTADSVIIAISQLLTSEVVKPLVPKNRLQDHHLAWVGRCTSLGSMVIGLLITLYAGQGISELIVIQYSLAVMAFPMFMIGMYYGRRGTDCHPWSLALGAWSGVVTVFGFHFGVNSGRESNGEPINSGMLGLLVNLAVVVLLELVRKLVDNADRLRPSWDRPHALLAKFGDEPLTGGYVWAAMKGVAEPVTQSWYPLLIICLSILCTPITETSTPTLDQDGMLLWAPNVVGGIPAWAFKILMALLASTMVLLYSISLLPNTLFPEEHDEQKDVGTSEEAELEETQSSYFGEVVDGMTGGEEDCMDVRA